MVLDISRVCKNNLDTIGHTQSSSPKVQTAEDRYMNVLCYNRGQGVFEKFIAQVKNGFFWVYEKAKGLFYQIISCCGLFQSSESQQLKIFKENLSKVQEVEKQFPVQVNQLKGKELKNWWRSQFDSLDHEVQEMLLIEDVKLRKPPAVNETPEKWAYDNLEDNRTLATEFIMNLKNEMIDGNNLSPFDYLPDYLAGLRLSLESKIKQLEAPKK